jgi:hypothetical protein
MKVQRPYVRTVDNKGNFQDVRDMSAIQTVRRHGPAFKKSGLLDIGDRREHWHHGETATVRGI